MSLIEPKLKEPDTGSPDDHAHYAQKADVVRAAIQGGLVTALCGVQFAPIRDPENYPTCQRCAELYELLKGL